MANNDIFAPPTEEELKSLKTDLFAPPSKEELSGLQPQESKGFLSSLGETALSGLQGAAQFVDKYTGAPVRAGIYAAQGGENPLSAYAKQFGEDSTKAPSGKDIVMRAGVKDQPVDIKKPGFLVEEEKRALGPAYEKYQENLKKTTPADILGTGMDIAADPTLLMTGVGKAVPAAAEAFGPVSKGAKGLLKSGLSKVSELSSGVPSEAAARLIERPGEVMAAGKPKAAMNIAEQARGELLGRNAQEGQKIGEARKTFAKDFGAQSVDTEPVVQKLKDVLEERGTVGGEEGALSGGEQKNLKGFIKDRLQSPSEAGAIPKKSAGSLQRFADYLKNQVNSFEQSRLPGASDTAYQSQLRQTYGKVKGLLHDIDPKGLGEADKQFHEFAKKTSQLGRLEDPETMESFVNNFYGKNKSLMRENAEGLLPQSIESLKDLGASKGFDVVGPSGSHSGIRNIMSAGAIGHGVMSHDPLQVIGGLMLQPKVQKQLLGRGSQAAGLLNQNPALKPLLRGGLIQGPNRDVNGR